MNVVLIASVHDGEKYPHRPNDSGLETWWMNADPLSPELNAQLNKNLGWTTCYQCEKAVRYLFDDSRCKDCTRLTPEEMRGEVSTEPEE